MKYCLEIETVVTHYIRNMYMDVSKHLYDISILFNNDKIQNLNVPSQVCEQCGEVSYSNEVAKQLEKLVNSVRNAIIEITVINYTEKVA